MNSKGIERIIEVNIDDEKDFFDRFNHDEMNEELSDYILRQCRKIGLSDKIKLEITTYFKLNDDDKLVIASTIKNYYKMRVRDYQILSRLSFNKNFIMTMVGIILILISTLFNSEILIVFNEIFTIAAWVLIWQAISDFLFVNANKSLENRRMKSLFKSDIVFIYKKDR